MEQPRFLHFETGQSRIPSLSLKRPRTRGAPVGITSRRPRALRSSHIARGSLVHADSRTYAHARARRASPSESPFPLGKLELFDARRWQCDFGGIRGNVSRSLNRLRFVSSGRKENKINRRRSAFECFWEKSVGKGDSSGWTTWNLIRERFPRTRARKRTWRTRASARGERASFSLRRWTANEFRPQKIDRHSSAINYALYSLIASIDARVFLRDHLGRFN